MYKTALFFVITILSTGTVSCQDLQDYDRDQTGAQFGAVADPFFSAYVEQQRRDLYRDGYVVTTDTYTRPNLLGSLYGERREITTTVTRVRPAGQPAPIDIGKFFGLPPKE